MKGLFLFQRRFAIIGHGIALALHKKYGVDIAGYVYLRGSKEWLEKQTDMKYGSLLLDDDIHKNYRNEPLDLDYLKKLETDYGLPNLWPHVTVDRIVMFNQLVREYPYNTPPYSHEEIMRLVQVKAKALTKFLDEEKPDFIFMTVVGAIGSSLLYYMAKKRNIPVFIGNIARLGDMFLLSENYFDNSFADKQFDQIMAGVYVSPKLEEAKKLLASYREKPIPYYKELTPEKQAVDRKKQFSFLVPKNLKRSIAWLMKSTLTYLKNKNRDDYQEIKPWYFFWDHLKRKSRFIRGFNDLYDTPVDGEDYAFYPLHFEPEIALMLYAPFFTDQIYVIKQIARSLPLHYKLYVKEHPAMMGYRPRAYYEELKKIPNVKLISPSTPSQTLIKSAKLITVVTGTVGWEALLMGKPVITFGDVFFNKLSMVKQCKTIEELPHIIKHQLENFVYNEAEMINYLAALIDDSVDVPLMALWEKEIDNQEKVRTAGKPVADLIMKKLGKA